VVDRWLTPRRDRQPLLPLKQDYDHPLLTEREREILRYVSLAATNAQIAYDLRISEHTVKTHLYNIFRKIRVRNRTQACNWIRANPLGL
jgi:DNA-binding CsgD family transcriptional regulator